MRRQGYEMSIATQVADSIDKMQARDHHGALFAICAPIGATADKEGAAAGQHTYKSFVNSNLGLISCVAFGGTKILDLKLAYTHPQIRTKEPGICTIEDVLYHAIRCGLYHESKLPDNLDITDAQQLRVDDNRLVLPASLIYGLIIAVVVSPANASESSPEPAMLNLGRFSIPLSKLWDRRNVLCWLLDVVVELDALERESGSPAESETT